jgi:hypothetical protein
MELFAASGNYPRLKYRFPKAFSIAVAAELATET